MIENKNTVMAVLPDTKELTRNYLFDNLKAVMIAVVVCTHYLHATKGFTQASLSGATYLWMISCDMIIFIFASGYFSKNVEKSRKRSFKTFLYPYILLSVVMFGVRYLIYGHASFSLLLPSLALWYMVVLFLYRFFLKDMIKLGKYLLPISFIVSVVAGLIPQLNSTLSLGRAFGFLPFFIIGYFCTSEHIKKIRAISKWKTGTLLVGLVAYSFFMAYEKVIPMSTWYLKSSYVSLGFEPLWGALVRSGLLFVALAWLLVFINLVPERKTWYTSVGVQSMAVYAIHLTFRHIIVKMNTDFGGGIYSFIIPIILALLTTWILSREPVAKVFNMGMDGVYNSFAYPIRVISKFIKKKIG